MEQTNRASRTLLITLTLLTAGLAGLTPARAAVDPLDQDRDKVPDAAENAVCSRTILSDAILAAGGRLGTCTNLTNYARPGELLPSQSFFVFTPDAPQLGEDEDGDGVASEATVTTSQTRISLFVRGDTEDPEEVLIFGETSAGPTHVIPLDPNDDDVNVPVLTRFESPPFFLPSGAPELAPDGDGDGVPPTLTFGLRPVKLVFDRQATPVVRLADATAPVPTGLDGQPVNVLRFDPDDADPRVPVNTQLGFDQDFDDDGYTNGEEILGPGYIDVLPTLLDAALDTPALMTDPALYAAGLVDGLAAGLMVVGQAAFFLDERNLADTDGDGFSNGHESAVGTDPNRADSHPNRAPVITAAPATVTADEGATRTFTVTVSDDDLVDETDGAVVLSLQVVGADAPFALTPDGPKSVGPDGLATFTVSFTTGHNDEGEFSVTFRASDDGRDDRTGTYDPVLSTSRTVDISVDDRNVQPELGSIGTKSVAEASTLAFTLAATDVDEEDALTFSMTNAPTGASLVDDAFTWTPGYLQAGAYSVTFHVADGKGGIDSETVAINVDDTNRPPVIAAIGAKSVPEASALSFDVDPSDPDADNALVVTHTTLPAGATFDAGTFSWTPTHAQAGPYSVTFTVDDGRGASDSEVVAITVTDVNRATTLAPIGAKSVAEGGTLAFTATASDPDADNTQTFSLSPLPPGASFNPDTGDFSWATGFLDAGTYPVTVSVDDGKGSTDDEAIVITVTETNRAPVLDPIGAKSVAEAATLTFTPTASDEDADNTFAITAAGLPAGATFVAGVFDWTPDHLQAGSYPVEFTVTDTWDATDTEVVTITVGDTNRVPVLATIGAQNVAEGTEISFSLAATDADTDNTLAYSADGLPDGATLVGATFTWTPDFIQAGAHAVTFRVTDGAGGEDSEVVTITVSDTNRLPVLAGIGDKAVSEGVLLTITPSATDVDSDNVLSFSAQGMPVGASFANGVFSWTPGYEQAASYLVTFQVSDGAGGTDSEQITITVADTNRAPVFDPIGPVTTAEAATLTLAITATDADADNTVSITASGLPTGATFNNPTFSWTPGYLQAGVYEVEFQATDNHGASVLLPVSITVTDTNRAPILGSIGAKTVSEAATLAFGLAATDDDTDNTLTYSFVGDLAGASLVGADFSWTPDYVAAGDHEVTFRVEDGAGGIDTEVVTITVSDTNRPVTLTAIGARSVGEGESLVITPTATDPDMDNTLVFSTGARPPGATFTDGAFVWTPGFLQAGTYDVTFSVADGMGSTDDELVTITVTDTNHAPALAAIGAKSVAEAGTVSFTPTASDPDSDNTFEIAATGLPAGATFDGGSFSWTPSYTQAGFYDVTFTVTDNHLATDTEIVRITVTDTNRPPTLGAIADTSGVEGDLVSFALSVTDADTDNDLSYDVAGVAGEVVLDGGVPTFRWTPTFLDAQDQAPTEYDVTVTVDDNAGATAARTFRITVSDTNRAPVLDPIGAKTVAELATLTITPTGSDADSDNTFSFTTGTRPAGATFAGGTFSWTPGYDAEGPHVVRFIVTDSTGVEDFEDVTITVTNTNRAPTVAITSQPANAARFLATLDTVTLAVNAADADTGETATLTYALAFGDGTVATASPAQHVYAAAGTYTLGACVTDARAATVCAVGGSTITVLAPDADDDGDGLTNQQEMTGSYNVGWGNQPTDPKKADTDGDGTADKLEMDAGSDPNRKRANVCDFDGDGLPNSVEQSSTRRDRNQPVQDGLPISITCSLGVQEYVEVGGDGVEEGFIVYVDEDEDKTFSAGDRQLVVVPSVADLEEALEPTRLRAEAARAAIEACLAETGGTTANTNDDAKPVCDALALARATKDAGEAAAAAARARAEAARDAIVACIGETGGTTANTNDDAKPVCDALAVARATKAQKEAEIAAAVARAGSAKAAIEACLAETGPTTANTNDDAKPVCDALALARATRALAEDAADAARARAEAAKTAIEGCLAETGSTTANTNDDAKPVCDALAAARGVRSAVEAAVAAAQTRAAAARSAIEACLAETGGTTANTNDDAKLVCDALAAARKQKDDAEAAVAAARTRAEAAKTAIEACLAETGEGTANTNDDAKAVCDALAAARGIKEDAEDAVEEIEGELDAARTRAEAARSAIEACLAETGPTTANTNEDAKPVCDALALGRATRAVAEEQLDAAVARANAAKSAIEACLAETGPTTANTNEDAKPVCDALATARGHKQTAETAVGEARARAEAAKSAIEACVAETGPTTANTNDDAKAVCDALAEAREQKTGAEEAVAAARARAEAAVDAIDACLAETGPTTGNTNDDAKPVCDALALARAGPDATRERAEDAVAAIDACLAETGDTTSNTNGDAAAVCEALAEARKQKGDAEEAIAAARARAEAAKSAIEACLAETGPTTANTNDDAKPVCDALAAAREQKALVDAAIAAARLRAENAIGAIDECLAETGPTTANTNDDAEAVCEALALARATRAVAEGQANAAVARADAARSAIEACLAETGPTTANTNDDADAVCEALALARGHKATVEAAVAAAQTRAQNAKSAIEACLAETGGTTANTNDDAKPVCDALAIARGTQAQAEAAIAAARLRAENAKSAIEVCLAETGPTTANTNEDAKPVCDALAEARKQRGDGEAAVAAARTRAEAAKSAIEACAAETGPTTSNTNDDADAVCEALALARATRGQAEAAVAAAQIRAQNARAAIEVCLAETGRTTANTNEDAKPVCDALAAARGAASDAQGLADGGIALADATVNGADPDRDFVPNAAEPGVCSVEDKTLPLDGTCVGNDYTPPGGLAPRPDLASAVP